MDIFILSSTAEGLDSVSLYKGKSGCLLLDWGTKLDSLELILGRFLPYCSSIDINTRSTTDTIDSIESCLSILFGSLNSAVKDIKISEGKLYIRDSQSFVRHQLNSLEFDRIVVACPERTISALSQNISSVNQLTFWDSQSRGEHIGTIQEEKIIPQFGIWMKETNVDTLDLYNCLEYRKNVIVLFIHFAEDELEKYFKWDLEADTCVEMN